MKAEQSLERLTSTVVPPARKTVVFSPRVFNQPPGYTQTRILATRLLVGLSRRKYRDNNTYIFFLFFIEFHLQS